MKKILPHAAIILSFMLLTLLVLDAFNPNMRFINNDSTKTLFGALCVIAIASSIIQVVDSHTRKREDK